MTEAAGDDGALAARVRRGLGWSALNNVAVRIGSLLVGVVLARLLAPADFGVFAVAMTVQLVLVTIAELGISADLIRRGQIERRGPTVAVIGLAAGGLAAALMMLLAGPLSSLLGASSAAPVVRVMSLTLVLSGLSAVPYARMQRAFLQSKQLLIDAGALILSSAVTIGLVWGFHAGAMSLAVGRIAAQALTTSLQYRVTRTRPVFGWSWPIAREVLQFGLPVAAANLMSWVVINVDNVIVGHTLGATSLGIYVLAFNLASWPMNAVGLTIRSVAMPAFAQLATSVRVRALEGAAHLTAALAAPLSILLMIFAGPAIEFLYGPKWGAAAVVLQALGAFGLVRVLFDLFASYLYGVGRSRGVLVVQVVWLMALAPSMIIGVRGWGLSGAAWAHVVVGFGILLPAYLVTVGRTGARVKPILLGLLYATLACSPAAIVGIALTRHIHVDWLALVVGGFSFTAVYVLLTALWVRRLLRFIRREIQSPAVSEEVLLEVSDRASGDEEFSNR